YSSYTAYRADTNAAHVLKWPTYSTMQTRLACTVALRKLALAMDVAKAFNQALHSIGSDLSVVFAPAQAVLLSERPGPGGRECWALLEPDAEEAAGKGEGSVMDYFCIFNDCNGGVVSEGDMVPDNDPDDRSWVADFHRYNDLAQALSCFSYYYSECRYLLINVQGVRGYFTNPDFHYAGAVDPFFSPNNGGDAGISAFFASFHASELAKAVLQTFPHYEDSWLRGEYISVGDT
ncbi:MAG: hypothetical protein KIT38_07400, partial [Gemmatimonadaceae bacterium]|nr:hypothetical protein [Gemmatimonadaceae bacterium]